MYRQATVLRDAPFDEHGAGTSWVDGKPGVSRKVVAPCSVSGLPVRMIYEARSRHEASGVHTGVDGGAGSGAAARRSPRGWGAAAGCVLGCNVRREECSGASGDEDAPVLRRA